MLISLNPFDFLSPPSQFLSLPLSINLAIIATSSQHSWSHGTFELILSRILPYFFHRNLQCYTWKRMFNLHPRQIVQEVPSPQGK